MTDEIKKDTVDYRDPTPFDDTKLNSISEISKGIRHKYYGKDAREALAQQGEALVKLMQETGGNQSAEVIAARGDFGALHVREDAQDEAIRDKFGLKDANKYLAEITAIPETFANLAAIKAKYPNGKNGVMVAADNGHKYIWNGTEWADNGVYQAVGVARKSINPVQTTFVNVDGSDIMANAKVIQGDLSQSTQQIQISSSNRLLYAECQPNTKYYIVKDLGTTLTIAFAKEVPVSGTLYYQKEYHNGEQRISVTCPNDCSYIYVWYWNKTVDAGQDSDSVFNSMLITDSEYLFKLSPDVTITKDNLQQDVIEYIHDGSAIQKSEDTGDALRSVYVANVENNLAIDRNDEIVKVKVNFEDGEILSPTMLKVKVDDSYVDFDWLGNTSELDDAVLRQQCYPSGFLRAGYVIFKANLSSLASLAVRIEVYAKKVTEFGPIENVKSSLNSDGVGSLSTNDLEVSVGGRVGYSISGLSYKGQNTFNGDYAERDGYVNENHEIPLFSTQQLLSYACDGYGTVCHRLRYRYRTQIDGIEMAITTIVYANNTIDVHKRYIFTKPINTYGLRSKMFFYSGSFISSLLPKNSNEVDNSVGGTIAGTNAVMSLITIQSIANGAADFFGDKGPQQFEGSSGFGINSSGIYSFSASLNEYSDGNAVTVSPGDSFGLHYVYNFGTDSLTNNQLRNFNPLVVQSSKILKNIELSSIQEDLKTYIVNNHDTVKNQTGFKGYAVLNQLEYAKINNSVSEELDNINLAFDNFVEYYGDANQMYQLYANGRGVEFIGRDSMVLDAMIKFYESINDTDRLSRAKKMIADFVDCFVKIEKYSGENGSIKLGYNGTDTLNSESAAIATMDLSANLGLLSDSQKTVCDRIKEHFLSLIQRRNILPYSPTYNITWQYKLHYHLFSLYDYVLFNDNPVTELNTMSYINQLTSPDGRFFEYDANYQSSRRAMPHGSMYAVGIALQKGDYSSVSEAYYILKDLLKNCYADGSQNYPLNDWLSSETSSAISSQNITIACAVAAEILERFFNGLH